MHVPKPGMQAGMYLCIMGIDFAASYDFPLDLGTGIVWFFILFYKWVREER